MLVGSHFRSGGSITLELEGSTEKLENNSTHDDVFVDWQGN